MQKNKFVHEGIKAVCNCAVKKLIAMGLVVAAMGSAVIPNIAQAQFDPNAGFYNTGEEKKETPEGDENKTDGDMTRNDDENKTDEDMPHNEEKEYLQIQTSLTGRKYVVIPAGVTAEVNQEGAFAVIGDDGCAGVYDDGTVTAGRASEVIAQRGSIVKLERLATIALSDGRTFAYEPPNEFFEVTSPDFSKLKDQEPFSLTRPLPVSPCPAPPQPELNENGSVSRPSFVQFLQALPKWIEDVAKEFKFDPDEAVIDTARVFFQTAKAKFEKK